MMHKILGFIRHLIQAIRHVRSAGQTTRARAVRGSERPARLCRECRQPIEHSRDWRDHLSH